MIYNLTIDDFTIYNCVQVRKTLTVIPHFHSLFSEMISGSGDLVALIPQY